MEGIKLPEEDCVRLRSLACELAQEAYKPIQEEKRVLWRRHNDLETSQPLVFCDPENGWNEIITPDQMTCESELGRIWEKSLRKRLFTAQKMLDDVVTDAEFRVPLITKDDGWGIPIRHVGGEHNGAYHIQRAIDDYERDFPRLHYPKDIVDWAASDRLLEEAKRVFDGLLCVKRYHMWWWSLGLTAQLIDLRGLEDFMCDMIDEPDVAARKKCQKRRCINVKNRTRKSSRVRFIYSKSVCCSRVRAAL